MPNVVYHLLGETGWSTVEVNGTRQNSKWTFSVGCARSISTTFSRKIGLKAVQAKRPGTSKNQQLERTFPLGNSVWEFWSTFQEIPFSRENFRSGRQNYSFHLHSIRNFRIFWLNGKQPECFIGYPSSSNFVKNTPLRIVFSTLFSVFGYPDETLSLVFDILLRHMDRERQVSAAIETQLTLNILDYETSLTFAIPEKYESFSDGQDGNIKLESKIYHVSRVSSEQRA